MCKRWANVGYETLSVTTKLHVDSLLPLLNVASNAVVVLVPQLLYINGKDLNRGIVGKIHRDIMSMKDDQGIVIFTNDIVVDIFMDFLRSNCNSLRQRVVSVIDRMESTYILNSLDNKNINYVLFIFKSACTEVVVNQRPRQQIHSCDILK